MPEETEVSREDLLKGLAELTTAVQEDRAEKDKAKEALAEISGKVTKLENLTRSKMEASLMAPLVAGADLSTKAGREMLITTPTNDERIKHLQHLNDALYLCDQMKRGKRSQEYPGIKSLKLFDEWGRMTSDFAKTMDTAESGAGAEWVPTTMSAELQRKIEIMLKVAAPHRMIPMPRSPFELPLLTSGATAYLATEQADADSITKFKRSKLGTNKVTFTAAKPAVRVLWTGEMDEDSIVPMMPVIYDEVGLGISKGIEFACIDGQLGGTIDTGDAPAADDMRKAWDGFRKYAETNSSVKVDIGATFTIEGFNSIRKAMGATGLDPSELQWIPSISAYYQMITLKDENGYPIVTPVYAYGDRSASRNGELGMLLGIPVVPSQYVREDLNVTGIYDGVTETKTIVILDHIPSWSFGRVRDIKIAASDQVYIESDILVIVATSRLDFEDLFPFATQAACGVGYNVTS